MGILSILIRNIRNKHRTKRPDDTVKVPKDFRGILQHDPLLCTSCKTCVYVCSPSAITFKDKDKEFTIWKYDAGHCSFCERCVEYCPTGALKIKPEIHKVTSNRNELYLENKVYYKPCPHCGKPFIPLPIPIMESLYGKPLTEKINTLQGLCEKCRQKEASKYIKDLLIKKRR